MSLFTCPFCGPRSMEEFTFHKTLPNITDGNLFSDTFERRDNPLDSHEHWQHRLGCRSWLYVRRNPSTGAVLKVVNLTSSNP